MSYSVVLQTADLIFVDKPHGFLTTPARAADDPRPCLGRQLQTQLGQQIFPVHRLDFEVSGLVLFALTSAAHAVAQHWFEHRQVAKYYQALSSRAQDVVPSEWEEWHSRLVRGKRRSFEAPHGQDSITRARRLGVKAGRVLWELQPVTGRPHQLRFEMAKHGQSIWGDKLYGGDPAPEDNWIALRATRLDFSGAPERLGLPAQVTVSNLEA